MPNRLPQVASDLLQFLDLGFLLDTCTQGSLLDHHSHNLKEDISSRHGSVLGISVICRGYLNDICCNEIDTIETAEDSAELPSRPAASLGSTSCWCNYAAISSETYERIGVLAADWYEEQTYKQDPEYQYQY